MPNSHWKASKEKVMEDAGGGEGEITESARTLMNTGKNLLKSSTSPTLQTKEKSRRK